MSEGAGVNRSRITFRAENMRSLREQQHIRYGPGTNNSALLDEPTILLNRSEKTMQTTLDTVDMNNSSVVKTTLRLNVEHSMPEELMASFEDMLVEYIANWDAINMTEEEIRQRASQLPLDSSLQQSIINVLRELAPGDRSVSLARSLSVSQFSYTQARKSLVDGPQFTEKEVIALSREHKVARDASTAQAVRSLLHSKHRLQVIGALQHLQQIRDRMHTDRSREILQLDHARLIARPHVISRDSGLYQSYTCYLCRNVFSSIEFLQAHLLSLKHHRLCLSKERRQVVKWAMEEPNVLATVMNTTSAGEGQEGTGTETPSILPDPSNEAKKGTENEATGNKNNSVFELLNKARNLKEVAENPNNTFTTVGVPSDAAEDIINPMKNVVFADLFDEAQRIRLLKSKNAIVLDYGTCLFCGTKVDLSPLVEVHRCTKELTHFIEQEIKYMNAHGSPLACLLCECRVYESPDALMVHMVGRHCAQNDSNQCPLCNESFPPSTAKLDPLIRGHILDRHLEQVHLPSLEVVGRLFHSFGDTVAPRSMMQAATNVLGLTRSFRCCFPAGQAAGKGPKFPYEHWYGRRNKVINDSRPSDDVGTNLANTTPGAQSKGFKRTSREIAHRFCLLNPREYYEKLRSKFERGGGVPSSIFTTLTTTEPWCAQTGQLSSMARFVAHVVGVHGGSPMLQSGLRENILETHNWSEKRKPKLPLVRSCGTLDFQERFSVWNPTRMALQALQQKVHLGSVPALQLFTAASPVKHSLGTGAKNDLQTTNEEGRQGRLSSQTSATTGDRVQGPSKTLNEPGQERDANKTEETKKNAATFVAHTSKQNNASLVRASKITDVDLRPQEGIICHLCGEGPMENDNELSQHLEHLHYSAYKERFDRFRRRGLLGGIIDPLKTCFQCYRVFDSFLALQVHLSVAHGTLYPLVCGLCHEPLTSQAFAEPTIEAEVTQMIETVLEKVDANLRDYVESHGALATVDLEKVLPPVDMTATTAAVRHAINAGLTIAIQVEELKAVRSVVRAGEAALRLPAINLLHAMKAHERQHVEEFRAKYRLQCDTRPSQREELLQQQVLCAQKRGLQGGLLMLVDELQDKRAEQVDCEQEKLTLPDTGSQSENSQTGSEPIIQNEPEDDDDEEEMLPGKPACITNTLWKHFKRCESLRIKLDAEDDDE